MSFPSSVYALEMERDRLLTQPPATSAPAASPIFRVVCGVMRGGQGWMPVRLDVNAFVGSCA